jgi:hypothetical protein
MACSHKFGNTSKAELFYLHAYQWNSARQLWMLDYTSSVLGDGNGTVIDFSRLNLTVTSNGYHQDWDLKYAPTTNNSKTNGLGPPGFLLVMSAKAFVWSSLFVLNQITINRGPGGEIDPNNCWSSSAGELDLIEPPFWAGVDLPQERLYTTVTANAGRCFPVEKAIPGRFQRECNDPYCCEMCGCPPGYVCFGDPRYAGYEEMGCVLANGTVPSGLTAFLVDGNNVTCGEYFGGIAGGSSSTAYFSHGPTSKDGNVIFAAVVDGDGTTVMRWPSSDAKAASAIWPGIGKYTASQTLQRNPDIHIPIAPPCENFDLPCGIHEPSCDNNCVINAASGVFGLYNAAGGYTAECARDGLNWWNLFHSTQQTVGMRATQLARYVYVPIHPTPLPYYCNVSCGAAVCHEENRCPVGSPFMCTKGDGNGGCSNSSSFWPRSPHCSACCDVRLCEVPCAAKCSPQQCDSEECNKQSAPYACTSGPLAGACSADRNYFPEQAGCYTCCDVRSCPGPR